MQLSLFDELHIYKDYVIYHQDITFKPSKMKMPYLVGTTDVLYHKNTALCQIQLIGNGIKIWSLSGKSCSSYKSNDIAQDLDKLIKMYK